MTVPMSRPSSTAPPGRRAKLRCMSIKAARTSANGGDDRGRLGHIAPAQLRLVEIGEGEAARRADRGRPVGEIVALVEQRPRGRPIEQSRIEMRQAEMRGEPARQSALARCRGAVDGDDHENCAPRRSISALKAGKLVAIMLRIVDRDGLARGEPEAQKAHGDAMIEMGGDEAAAGDVAAAPFDDKIVADRFAARARRPAGRPRPPRAGRIP